MAASHSIFSNANGYERYVGRWSRIAGRMFVGWLRAAPGGAWLDLGSGTGVLTQVILDEAAPAWIVGVDSSPDYLDFARQHIHDDRVEFRIGDASALDFEGSPFEVAVAGLVLNFTPDPLLVVRNMKASVRPGGLVGAYVWDYGGKMEMMRYLWDVAASLDPEAARFDSGARFTICQPENLRALFVDAGLEAVEVIPLDFESRFTSFEDYWQPITTAQGSIATYLRGLTDEQIRALRDALRERLPTTSERHIALNARVWAVKGTRRRG